MYTHTHTHTQQYMKFTTGNLVGLIGCFLKRHVLQCLTCIYMYILYNIHILRYITMWLP